MEQNINTVLNTSENSHVLNIKNESEHSETEILPSFEHQEYFEDIDEDDEEFEDAIDQIINQNFSECLQQTGLSSNTESSTINSILEQPAFNIDTLHVTDSNLLQKLVEKQRNELALELRRLQFSSHQQEIKNRLEALFNNTTPITISSGEPVNRSNTFRSQNILNEISELDSQHRVSNLSSNLRENFERTLQNRPNPNRLPASRLSEITIASNVPSIVRESIQRSIVNQNTNEIISNPSSNLAGANINSRISATNTAQVRPVIPFLENHNRESLYNMTRVQIISEISELVHRQLVNNTLQSDFRPRLENSVLNRLNQSGLDGARTRQNVNDILRVTRAGNIQRNDFSHLGIDNNNQELSDPADNLDSASSYSNYRQSHRTHRTQSILNNAREIKELKFELNEIKSLLKLSFELQLDMQRSFKQEISALVSGTFHDSASANLINSSQPINGGKCIICTEEECDTVFYQCGHIVSCYKCSLHLKNKGHNCPVCRAPIKDILKTYKSN